MKDRGFSVIELVLAACVISLLAAIAIPNYRTHQRAAKVTQRAQQIQLIEEAARRHWAGQSRWPTGTGADSTLSATWNPAALPGGKGEFLPNAPTWKILQTPIEGVTRFQYQLIGEHTPASASFTLTVRQDLDGDGVHTVVTRTSTFARQSWSVVEVVAGDVEH